MSEDVRPSPKVSHTHRVSVMADLPGGYVDWPCHDPAGCPQTVLAQLLWEAYVGHVEKKDWKAWSERVKVILDQLERGT